MSKRALLALLLLLASIGPGLMGCSDDDEIIGDDNLLAPAPSADVQLTCEGCHTSEAYLRATVLPDPIPTEPEGEG